MGVGNHWRQIVYQVEFKDNYEDVKEQDTADAFQYCLSGWNTDVQNLSSYDNNTGQ